MQDELKNIISGIGENAGTNLIQTALRYLRASKAASRTPEKPELFNKEDKRRHLIQFAEQKNLWITCLNEDDFIAEGAEQKLYLDAENKHVLKTNDTIF